MSKTVSSIVLSEPSLLNNSPNIIHLVTSKTIYAALFLTLAVLSFSNFDSAGLTITVPGPNIHITGPAPLYATVTSTGAVLTNVKVLDGTTQLGSYAGNGTSLFSVHAVYPLGAGSHTITVTGTDAN